VSENNALQHRTSGTIRDRGQYFIAFGIIGSMLLVAGFPVFVVFFFGVFAYFLLRMFTASSRNETREIFEFYLSANEILRDDGRRWFGFEIKEALERGEAIVHRMPGAPPLVYFALGALHHKAGDHQSAINCLTYAIEGPTSDESTYVYPSPELKNYAKVLRKIEREPADAPMTSAAVRALDRARKLRGRLMLEESRALYVASQAKAEDRALLDGSQDNSAAPGTGNGRRSVTEPLEEDLSPSLKAPRPAGPSKRKGSSREKADPYANRKPISEVLHDIYDQQ
jgi:tetratricopeptide (TPR) repeat protein